MRPSLETTFDIAITSCKNLSKPLLALFFLYAAAAAKSLQSCPTVAHQAPLSLGILQARILERVAMPSPPGDLPHPGIKPQSPALQTDPYH